MKPIRIGVVGLGWVGTHRHIPAIRKNKHFQLIGVADRKADSARQWADRLGVAESTADSIDGISWLDQVDAVDIATAPMAHYSLIREALLRGKHVITEKPFTMTLNEGEEIVALAAERQRRLCIVHNFQFASSVLRLQRDIASGRIGKIRSIVAFQWGNPERRLPSWYGDLPGGLFYDESPHLLYLVRKLAPGPLRISTVDSCPGSDGKSTPASIDASYRCDTSDGEIPVSVNCRFEAPLSEWHIAVLGEKEAGIVDVFRNIYLRLPNDGAHDTRTVLRTSVKASVMHWLQHFTNGPKHLTGNLLYGNEHVFKRFAKAINQNRDADDISGADALDVLRMQWDILSHTN